MKLPHVLLSGVAAAALALPVAVAAQTAPAPNAGAPAGYHHPHRPMAMFRALNLSATQKQQIHTLFQQFRAAHPKGSKPDRAARKQLHQQIMAVLTPQQRAQLKAERQKMRAERRARMNGNAPVATPTPAR